VIFRDGQSAEIGVRRDEQRPGRAQASIQGGTLVMVIALATGATGLTYFACHVSREDRRVESNRFSAASTKVNRYAAIRIWLPRPLIEVAKRRPSLPPMRTHEELQRMLETERLRDVWYALTVREHHDNGEFNDLTIIRRPYDDPRFFPELPEVLAVAVGEPVTDPAIDFSLASVCVVHADFGERTPREVMSDVLAKGRE
jgi:hypothetical protein